VGFSFGPDGGEGEGDDAAPCADVSDAGGRVAGEVRVIAEEADEFFGFWAWDECAGVATKGFSEKIDGAEEVLEWFSGGAAFDEFAKWGEDRFAEGSIELGVEFHSTFFAEGVSEKVFDVEARTFDLVFREVAGGGLDDFENRFHGRA
jgi:hypothetical protein